MAFNAGLREGTQVTPAAAAKAPISYQELLDQSKGLVHMYHMIFLQWY